MRTFFMFKGNHKITSIEDIAGKAHAFTPEGTFKIKENTHSDTFLIKSQSTSSGSYTQISKIYELAPLNYREIYDSLEFSSLLEINGWSTPLTRSELFEFSKKYFLFISESNLKYINMAELCVNESSFISEPNLKYKNMPIVAELCVDESSFEGKLSLSVSKINYLEIIKILKYCQSLESMSDFNLYERSPNGLVIKKWVQSTFKGNSFELGFFILLDCLEKNKIEDFIIEWKKADLYDVDIRGFLEYLKDTFLDKREQIKVRDFLLKLI